MPLLDHFNSPVRPRHSWESFHGRWAYALADQLNRVLPPDRYLAEATVRSGTHVETDVAEFEMGPPPGLLEGNGAGGGNALQAYAPSAATKTVEMFFPDDFEIQVFDLRRDRTLVAAIELISPGNKDRPDTRRAFVAKCIAYLQRGIGLIVVDIVTDRTNLQAELLEMLGQDEQAASKSNLYAVAYRPARRGEGNFLDLWPVDLHVGQPLPLLPLALRGTMFVPVDLEAAYTETRKSCHL